MGEEVKVAGSLHQLGDVAHKLGDNEEARRLYERSVEIYERFGLADADAVRESLLHLEQCLGKES